MCVVSMHACVCLRPVCEIVQMLTCILMSKRNVTFFEIIRNTKVLLMIKTNVAVLFARSIYCISLSISDKTTLNFKIE